MHSAFELWLSTDAPYRALAADVAGKVVELAGGATAEAQRFGADIIAVVDELSAGTGTLALRFATDDTHVEAVVDGDGRTRTVRCRIAGRKD